MRLEELPAGAQSELLSSFGTDRPKKKSKTSEAADLFAFQLRAHRFEGWEREHKFAKDERQRLWRFDFAHLEHRIAVEVEGLVVRRIAGQMVCMGRHATPQGFQEDLRKYMAAFELGWYVLRVDQKLVASGEAIASIERVLARRGVTRGT